MLKIVLSQLVEQVRIGFVGENVLASMGRSTGVEVGVGEVNLVSPDFSEKTLVVIQRVIDTRDIEILSFPRGDFKVHGLERPDFRHKPQKERQHSGTESRTTITFTPFLLIVRPRKIVAKFSGIKVRRLRDNLLFPRQKCDSRHLGDYTADCPAKGSDGQI